MTFIQKSAVWLCLISSTPCLAHAATQNNWLHTSDGLESIQFVNEAADPAASATIQPKSHKFTFRISTSSQKGKSRKKGTAKSGRRHRKKSISIAL